MQWQRYGHACGICGWFAPIGAVLARKLTDFYLGPQQQLPRVGYMIDLWRDPAVKCMGGVLMLINRAGSYEVQF